MTEKTDKDDSWSKAINTTVNIIVVTALVAVVFGFFAAFGAMFALKMF
nr:hypothetical protein [uncultured Psychrobacter sp.]